MTAVHPPGISIPYKLFIFDLALATPAPVSGFLAATIRGGFGITLRDLVCTTKHISCTACILKHTCVYSWLFDTSPPTDARRLANYEAIPRPFTFRPRQEENTLDVGLLLIGNAVTTLPYFIYTFNRLGEKGLGKHRARFSVRSVKSSSGEIVYPVGNGEVAVDIQPEILLIKPGEKKNGSVVIEFKSPVVIRKDGRILESFEPYPFITTLLRRVTNINAFYGVDKKTNIDPASFIDAAATITATADMHPVRRERFSTRQQQDIDYSGLLGTATLHGDVGTLLPLLKAGEILGVGKNTVFGFGEYVVRMGGKGERDDH